MAPDCREIKIRTPSASTGLYPLEGAEGDKIFVFCDMDTDGGGWTLVQRTVWESSETDPLRTGFQSWLDVTVGDPSDGGFRLAGRNWPSVGSEHEHLVTHRPRTTSDEECEPLHYKGVGGVISIDKNEKEVLLVGLQSSAPIATSTLLSTVDSGPNADCVTYFKGVPWFYAKCCATCPVYKGGYWDAPHPMVDYIDDKLDLYGKTVGVVCGGQQPVTSKEYYGLQSMEYFLR